MPGTASGKPARSAATRPRLLPVAPSGKPTPRMTSSTSAGSTPARATACATACPASVAPCVWLYAPRNARPIGVRATETITASDMGGLLGDSGVPHRAAAVGRKAVAVYVHDV